MVEEWLGWLLECLQQPKEKGKCSMVAGGLSNQEMLVDSCWDACSSQIWRLMAGMAAGMLAAAKKIKEEVLMVVEKHATTKRGWFWLGKCLPIYRGGRLSLVSNR
ncbi:hypothetical protein Pyn_14832 [Prunus yedoensis var. nudiflora]|uniref:Uncharacterized protein n=1 Tax=Prunus yedoensis var. nudiflora TaxID=2094558 RepID=A0A314XQK3_PRUYE|nr:hypothetical protein Pyn_14832 [Prunus yedoensis var. nudiflora]